MNANQNDLVTSLVVFLGGREDDLERFFAVSGVEPSDLRTRLADPGFQRGLLDYVMMNEPLLLAFCEEAGHDPASFVRLVENRETWG